MTAELATALDGLLELWRQRRAPELAAAIERLSARLTRRLDGATLKERLAGWRELEAGRRVADLGTLLAAMTESPATEARRQIERLMEWPDDPRLLELLGLFPAWAPVLQLLAKHGDPRAIPALEAVGGQTAKRLVQKLRARFPDGAPPIDETATAALAEVEALLAASPAERTEAELVTEVYARPDDDEPRLVLADLLLQRGDARGELIQLQCLAARQELTAEQARRAAQLERKHARVCYGTLAPVCASGELARGFPRRIRLKPGSKAYRLIAAPEWATVEELDVAELWKQEQLSLVRPHLPRLRALVGLRTRALLPLLDEVRQPLRLATLGCLLNDHTHLWVGREELLRRTAQLPALARLAIGGSPPDQDLDWLLAAPLGRKLRALELPHTSWTHVWLRALERADWIEELCVREDADSGFERHGWSLTLTRDREGRLGVLTAAHDDRRRVGRLSAPQLRLAADLARLAPTALSELHFGRCLGVTDEGHAELDAALARQTRLPR